MTDADSLLKQIGNLIDQKLESVNKQLEDQGKNIKTIKADVVVVKDVTTHTQTAVKALDLKVDATKAQLERKIKQRPQKAD